MIFMYPSEEIIFSLNFLGCKKNYANKTCHFLPFFSFFFHFYSFFPLFCPFFPPFSPFFLFSLSSFFLSIFNIYTPVLIIENTQIPTYTRYTLHTHTHTFAPFSYFCQKRCFHSWQTAKHQFLPCSLFWGFLHQQPI